MLLAMCFDTSMLIGFLFFMLIAGLVVGLALIALFVLVSMGVVKIMDVMREHPDTVPMSPHSVP